MRKIYQWLGLAGALIWSAAVLIRSFHLTLPGALSWMVGVAPNFGVAWLLMGLFVSAVPILQKRESTRRERFVAMLAIMGILTLSEVIHASFLGAFFAPNDLAASLAALLPLLIFNAIAKQPA